MTKYEAPVIYDFKTEPCKEGYYQGALVISPERSSEPNDRGDYHFYRQMGDKTWMHKRGCNEVTTLMLQIRLYMTHLMPTVIIKMADYSYFVLLLYPQMK